MDPRQKPCVAECCYILRLPGGAMAREKWDETGRIWEKDDGWPDDEQLAKCARANEIETFDSPVPTRMVSNGEYMPVPQTKEQKAVEARIAELAETASKKL